MLHEPLGPALFFKLNMKKKKQQQKKKDNISYFIALLMLLIYFQKSNIPLKCLLFFKDT